MIYLKAALFFPRLTKAEQRKEAHVKICKKARILQDKRHTKIFQKFPSAGLNAAYSFYYASQKACAGPWLPWTALMILVKTGQEPHWAKYTGPPHLPATL